MKITYRHLPSVTEHSKNNKIDLHLDFCGIILLKASKLSEVTSKNRNRDGFYTHMHTTKHVNYSRIKFKKGNLGI